MAYEFLKKLFGKNEDGTPKALTFEELEAAIEADTDLKLVDLATGDYVAKGKFDAKSAELTETKKMLTDANAEIQSYKDMDIDGIKQAAADWETKYNADIAARDQKLAEQAREFATREYFSKFQFTSDLAKEAAFAAFLKQEFKQDESGKFLGADDYMKGLKESNPGAFVSEEPAQEPKKKPSFASTDPTTPPKGGKKMTLTEKMQYAAQNPGIDIDTLFD